MRFKLIADTHRYTQVLESNLRAYVYIYISYMRNTVILRFSNFTFRINGDIINDKASLYR